VKTRRATIKLATAALASGAAFSLSGCKDNDLPMQAWNGEVLGAPASIKFRLNDEQQTFKLFDQAQIEIARLAQIFSLYLPNSEISELNRNGGLASASPEMIEVLTAARHISETTGGAFDCTIQPLWNLSIYLQNKRITREAAVRLWAQARALVDYKGVNITGRRISFAKPGMAITLNGLVQGYITDKVVELLQAGGVKHGLVDIGEYRAFGKGEAGKNWRVGIQDPNNVLQMIVTTDLNNQGLATSASGAGQVTEQITHIFDARAGRSPEFTPAFSSASVVADRAMIADGYATAFTLMDEADIRKIVKSQKGMGAILVRQDGETVRI
jgi:thiamine biosynthesis lipoprotein